MAEQAQTEEGLAQGQAVAGIAKDLDMTIDPETGEPMPKPGK